VTNGPDGIPWLQDFIKQCSDCQIDFVQAHWYGGNMGDFTYYIEKLYDVFKKPIWLTEFRPDHQQPVDRQIEFLKQVMDFWDATDYVERYAWFMAMPNASANEARGLVNADGSLNELGNVYDSH
jgi:O-glycosyl hydrolase